MMRIGRHDEFPFPDTQQVVFPQNAIHALGIHPPSAAPQLCRDSRPPVTRPLQSNSMDRIAQIHIRVVARRRVLVEAVEAGAADPPQLHHALHRQPPAGLHFLFDLPVDGGFPANACSIRCSSMRCKHPFKKSISSACWPIFLSSSAIRPSDQRCLPLPGNTLPGASRNSRRQRCSTFGLTSTPRATSAIDTPCSSRRTAANLNSFVNCLRDNPIDS